MCGCSTHEAGNAGRAAVPKDGSLTLHIEDMTCGHCAGTIKKAVESALPETQVDADLASKLVSIRGTVDLSAVTAIVTEAGYTPSTPTRTAPQSRWSRRSHDPLGRLVEAVGS